MESKIFRLVVIFRLFSATSSVYVGGSCSCDRSGRLSKSSGNNITNRSRNLLRVASVAPVDPSVVFLTIDQLRPSNSHKVARNLGNPPSNRRYHRANHQPPSLPRL